MTQLKSYLGEKFSAWGIVPYKSADGEYVLCFKKAKRTHWAVGPYITKAEDISKDELRKKAKAINEIFPLLSY